jgi:TnpA family transposase
LQEKAEVDSMPIECTDRDAAFVLDGLLYNESDLEIEEHYTDTHGYTELNFAAFAMLGRRFCPRIKDVKHQHIYRIDATMDYGQLAHIVGRADRTIDPQTVVDHWDRMGQFYASLESGHTTASVALQRLVSCIAKNHFYRANRDLGRIFKTEFLLSYLSEPRLRARIRRGLLKVEQLHALRGISIMGGEDESTPAKISTSVSWSMSAPSKGKTSFFTASMCSTRTTFAKTDP